MRYDRTSTWLAVLALLAAGVDAATLGAQGARDAGMIPRELLVSALTVYGGYGAARPPDVQVGEIPADIRSQLPDLSGMNVIGTVTMPYGTTVVLGAAIPSDSLRHMLERALKAKGFEPAKPIAREGPSSGQGFIASPDRSTVWCSPRSSLVASTESRGSGASVARIVVGQYAAVGRCPQQNVIVNVVSDFSMLPTLYDPEGASSNTQKCGRVYRSSSSNGIRNIMALELAPSSILDHYGKQLRDSGWTRADTLATGVRVTRSWLKRTAGGDQQYLTLSVVVPADQPQCRVVEATVDRVRIR